MPKFKLTQSDQFYIRGKGIYLKREQLSRFGCQWRPEKKAFFVEIKSRSQLQNIQWALTGIAYKFKKVQAIDKDELKKFNKWVDTLEPECKKIQRILHGVS